MIKSRRRPSSKAMRNAPVNPTTVRTRRFRALAKLNRRDPVRVYRVRLPQSVVAKITLSLTATKPQDRDQLVFTDADWEREIAAACVDIIKASVK